MAKKKKIIPRKILTLAKLKKYLHNSESALERALEKKKLISKAYDLNFSFKEKYPEKGIGDHLLLCITEESLYATANANDKKIADYISAIASYKHRLAMREDATKNINAEEPLKEQPPVS